MIGRLGVCLHRMNTDLPFVITPGPSLYVLTGPTAVGKTTIALDWAETHNCEILSCDSLLVYQGMNIGTAKPTAKEMSRVPHHGIDCVPVTHAFNVSEYIDLALTVISDVFGRGKSLLVTGGTGFYLKSFFAPVVDETPVTKEVVDSIQALYEADGLEGLVEKLHQLNPDGMGAIDVQNPRRVIKALQRCMATGQTVLELQGQFKSQPLPFADVGKQTCLLSRDADELKLRVATRAQKMIEDGLIQEVESLRECGIFENPSAARAIGYRETLAWLEDPTDLETLTNQIIQNTCKLLRKQRIWFRHQIVADYLVELS